MWEEEKKRASKKYRYHDKFFLFVARQERIYHRFYIIFFFCSVSGWWNCCCECNDETLKKSWNLTEECKKWYLRISWIRTQVSKVKCTCVLEATNFTLTNENEWIWMNTKIIPRHDKWNFTVALLFHHMNSLPQVTGLGWFYYWSVRSCICLLGLTRRRGTVKAPLWHTVALNTISWGSLKYKICLDIPAVDEVGKNEDQSGWDEPREKKRAHLNRF